MPHSSVIFNHIGKPNRESVNKTLGSKKLKNIEKKRVKKNAREAIIDYQNQKKIQYIRQRDEKSKEAMKIQSNLDAEIREKIIIEELKYKELAEEIVMTSEGSESNLSETLLQQLLRSLFIFDCFVFVYLFVSLFTKE